MPASGISSATSTRRDFYKRVLGFDETFVDWDDRGRSSRTARCGSRSAEGEPNPDGGGSHRRRLGREGRGRAAARAEVAVGSCSTLAGQMRLVDVYDPTATACSSRNRSTRQ
jgi:hypothetical protein